jgi:hypothetical protein
MPSYAKAFLKTSYNTNACTGDDEQHPNTDGSIQGEAACAFPRAAAAV